MAFFNEFPHTRTYDSDLAWLIERMKEVLTRMDSVEARMQALEELVENFISTLNIDQLIADQLRQMVADGTFEAILEELTRGVMPTIQIYNQSEIDLLNTTRDTTPEQYYDWKIGTLLIYKTATHVELHGSVYGERGAASSGSMNTTLHLDVCNQNTEYYRNIGDKLIPSPLHWFAGMDTPLSQRPNHYNIGLGMNAAGSVNYQYGVYWKYIGDETQPPRLGFDSLPTNKTGITQRINNTFFAAYPIYQPI